MMDTLGLPVPAASQMLCAPPIKLESSSNSSAGATAPSSQQHSSGAAEAEAEAAAQEDDDMQPALNKVRGRPPFPGAQYSREYAAVKRYRQRKKSKVSARWARRMVVPHGACSARCCMLPPFAHAALLRPSTRGSSME